MSNLHENGNSPTTLTRPWKQRLHETVRVYLPLGWTAFGGPTAHIGLFHQIFIEKLGWLQERTFSEFFGICQALPGPASTQMAYIIAMYRNGMLAAVVAFLLWSLPGWSMMTLLAVVVAFIPANVPRWVPFLTNGLGSVAIGLAALAAYRLTEKVIKHPAHSAICWLSASIAILYQAQWLPPSLILAGGFGSVAWFQWKQHASSRQAASARYQNLSEEEGASLNAVLAETSPEGSKESLVGSEEALIREAQASDVHASYFLSLRSGVLVLVTVLVVLVLCFLLRETLPKTAAYLPIHIFAVFYITGTIIFGGGPVVIPLLYSYVVDPGWMSNNEFVMGLTVINLLPGPNFNFGAYCGGLALRNISKSMRTENGGYDTATSLLIVMEIIVGSLLGYIGIFLPGLAVKTGVLPVWKTVQRHKWVSVALEGVSAAAIGLVWSAVYLLAKNAVRTTTPTCTEGGLLGDPVYLVMAMTTFIGLAYYKYQPFVMIALGTLLSLLYYFIHPST